MLSLPVRPEEIHPTLWLAAQRVRSNVRGVDTGHPELTAELPDAGWPPSALIELLVQQPGIGELRLLAPLLARATGRPVVLIQPPHALQPLALAYWGIDPSGFITLPAPRTADALWAAGQVLRAGTCAAVLLWQANVRADALRRLNLAAQGGAALFFVFRPVAAAGDASPAPLRLALTPKRDGIDVTFVKRRGPARDTPLFVPLSPSPVLFNHHVSLDRCASAAPQPRNVPATIAGVIA